MAVALKSMITFSERKDFDPALLVRLYDCAPWAQARTVDGIREMLAQTDLAMSVWDGPQLVGFGRVAERPWAENGALRAAPLVNVSLAADHRVSDGHRGARFLAALRELLQHPEAL